MNASVAGIGQTRQRILEAASSMLSSRSYLGFSFNDISQQVGVRKASLHHHFTSKEVLGLELLALAAARFQTWSESAPDSPSAAIGAFIAMYRNSLRAGMAVCPGGSFAPGWGCTEDTLKAAVRKLRADQIQWLTKILRAQDKTRSRADASAIAASVFATCQGALVSARVTGNVKDFDVATTVVRVLVETTV